MGCLCSNQNIGLLIQIHLPYLVSESRNLRFAVGPSEFPICSEIPGNRSFRVSCLPPSFEKSEPPSLSRNLRGSVLLCNLVPNLERRDIRVSAVLPRIFWARSLKISVGPSFCRCNRVPILEIPSNPLCFMSEFLSSCRSSES